MVYAIQTSTSTFVADGLAHHNCRHCNCYLEGNTHNYMRGLEKKYGSDIFAQLEYESQQPFNPSAKFEYADKIIYYKQQVKELKADYGI